jgi:hypothetical protein
MDARGPHTAHRPHNTQRSAQRPAALLRKRHKRRKRTARIPNQAQGESERPRLVPGAWRAGTGTGAASAAKPQAQAACKRNRKP